MRFLGRTCFWVGLLACSIISAAQAEESSSLVRLDISLRNTTLQDSVRQVFDRTGLQVVVDRELPEVRLTLALKDVELDHAMRLLVRQAAKQVPGLDFEPTSNGYRIFRGVKPVAASEEAKPIRFKLRKPLERQEAMSSELGTAGGHEEGIYGQGKLGTMQSQFGPGGNGFGGGQSGFVSTYTQRLGRRYMFGGSLSAGSTLVTLPAKGKNGKERKVWIPRSSSYSYYRIWDPSVTYWSGGVTPHVSQGGSDKQYGGGYLPKK